jgi:UDP-N-acetylmuramate dehydrogenase
MNIEMLGIKLKNALDEEIIFFNEMMRNHTTFKIGGPADIMVMPRSEEEILKILEICKALDIKPFIMGNGSNILVSDKGYRGIIIKIAENYDDFLIDGETAVAKSGILLSKLAKEVLKCSLEGFEFASGIPGTLGGAVFMNAGAYGGEMKDVVQWVKVINEDGDVVKYSNEDMEFGYRTSIAQEKHMFVLECGLKLGSGDYHEIKAVMDGLKDKRTSKQPLELPSAGSTFKRPVGHFAGKLIDDSGLRGVRVGGAQVSQKHCGFVVNVGNATCEDVLDLIKLVQKVVKDTFGVEIDTEVRMIGEF